MPEKIEIALMAESLNKRFKDKILHTLIITPKSRYYSKPIKGYDIESWIPLQEKIIIPFFRTCQNVSHRGKKIIFFFDEICVINSCGLEGHWGWEEEKHSGIILQFENCNAYFTDSRHFGEIDIIFKKDLSTFLKHIGPDYFYGEVSLEIFSRKICDPKLRDKQICWFLLEQKFFSGIGNWLKADVLYKAKILPHRLLKDLTFPDIERLYFAIMYTLKEAYESKGCTIKSYRNPDGEIGNYKNVCYGRQTDNYGNPIITQVLSDKRNSYFCPNVQI